MRDLYKVLGIRATADATRIKTAFRRRAKAYHPDLNQGSKRAEERFKELTQAYEVLRSAHARARYDTYRTQRRSEARRRLAQSAAMMVVSFAITMGSAYGVMALNGSGLPLREGWQVAVSAIRGTTANAETDTAAALATATTVDKRAAAMAVAETPPAATDASAATAWTATTTVRRHRSDTADKAQATVIAAIEAQRRHAAERGGGTGWRWPWEWPEADGSYMGLGATGR